jgi:hypothetical protein
MQVYTFNPHLIHLFVTTFLTLFLKVFNLEGKDASKSAVVFRLRMKHIIHYETIGRDFVTLSRQRCLIHLKMFVTVPL